MNNQYVIIVAGGSGSRMKSALPKQFLELKGKPILMHTIEKFYEYNPDIKIHLALPKDYLDLWDTLCTYHNFDISHKVIKGGNERFFSVKNVLDTIEDNGTIAIHDSVRPLVSKETIKEAFKVAEEKGNAIPTITINDSLREISENGNKMVDRSRYVKIHTPQCFDISLIKEAYEQEFNNGFTDDSSVLESLGHKINLTKSNLENIKITTQTDLIIAEAFINNL